MKLRLQRFPKVRTVEKKKWVDERKEQGYRDGEERPFRGLRRGKSWRKGYPSHGGTGCEPQEVWMKPDRPLNPRGEGNGNSGRTG